MFSTPSLRCFLAPVALAVLLVSCGGDETDPGEDHTPVNYAVLINGQEVDAPYALVEGETVRLQLKFFNQANEDLDDVEDTHFGGITFNPASLASATRVSGHNYQFDVTGGAPGSGTVQVRYGHDDPPDEVTFPGEAVIVNPADGGNPQ